MATWFDRDRGFRSGRIEPRVLSPADGEHVFVLGAEDLEEVAEVAPGDYARVSQTVDLTDYDLVTANMKTIGKLMSQYIEQAGFLAGDPDLVFWFNFNVGSDPTKNLRELEGGEHFPLNMNGEIAPGIETYSPNGTYCRVIGEGAGIANMRGNNTPQAFPSSMSAYTLQWWMNFDTSVYPASTGVSPTVFSALNTPGGIRVDLLGAAGLHEWNFEIVHGNGGVVEGVPILDYTMDAPEGWKLYTIRYDQALTPPYQCQLFMNDTLVGGCATPFLTVPIIGQPSSPVDVIYGDAQLVGGIDDIRLVSRHLTTGQIISSYERCIQNQDPIDFTWTMKIEINERVYAERVIRFDERRTWTDFIAPVRLLTGEHEVAFTLQLEQVIPPPPPPS